MQHCCYMYCLYPCSLDNKKLSKTKQKQLGRNATTVAVSQQEFYLEPIHTSVSILSQAERNYYSNAAIKFILIVCLCYHSWEGNEI